MMCPHSSTLRFGGRGAAARSSASSKKADKEDVVSAEPDFAVSGKLAAETNTYKVRMIIP